MYRLDQTPSLLCRLTSGGIGQNGVLAGLHAKVVRQPFGAAAAVTTANGLRLESEPPQAKAYRVAWLVSTVQVLPWCCWLAHSCSTCH